MNLIKWKRKAGKKYDFWSGNNGQTLFVQSGDNIKVVPLRAGIFEIKKMFRVGVDRDTGPDRDIVFEGGSILELGNEKEAQRALLCLKKTLKKTGKRSASWITLAAIAATFIVGMTFATAYSTSVGLRSAVPASPIVAQQVRPLMPPPAPSGRIDPATIPTVTNWSFGNPKGRTIYVFSDPQCPHCKTLEQSLSSFKDDYLIKVYPTPRLGDDSAALIAQIACDADPATAWSKWMTTSTLNQKAEIKQDCVSAGLASADVNKRFLDQHNLFGVPVIIRDDGNVHTGEMDKASLQQWLQDKKIPQVASSTCGN